jgi:hypothetical protein
MVTIEISENKNGMKGNPSGPKTVKVAKKGTKGTKGAEAAEAACNVEIKENTIVTTDTKKEDGPNEGESKKEETETKDGSPKEDEQKKEPRVYEDVVFTRYLYPKLFVKQSLMLALLDQDFDETMNWLYELYFSGFEDETYDYIFQLYNEFYKYDNPGFIEFMEATRKEWYEDTLKYWLIASIVATLVFCNYRMDKFVETYFKVRCAHIQKPTKRLMIIHMKEEDVREFKINRATTPPRAYLPLVCKYPIRTNVNRLFMIEPTDLHKKWRENWTYYAGLSPLWEERMETFSGKMNRKEKKVEFQDEKLEEEFYEKWNLEPDEQPKHIRDTILGNDETVQMGLMEFCERYGCPIVAVIGEDEEYIIDEAYCSSP